MKKEIICLYQSLVNFDLYKELADAKMRARYNRTVLGPFWEIFGALLLLLLLSFLWSKLWNVKFIDFFTYLLVGYTLWRTILSTTTDACQLYSYTYTGVLKNVKIHPFVLAISCAYKNFLTLLMNFPLIFFILYLNNQLHFSSIFFTIFFLFLFFLSSIAASFLLAVLCLKYRDLEHTIGVLLGMVFFFTPIIWNVDQLGDNILYIQANILYHYIYFFRSGLQNGEVNFLSIIVVAVVTFLLILLALYVSKKTNKKIAYWID
jgi:ABC-type polysaccharide/polyol phosphate export permease